MSTTSNAIRLGGPSNASGLLSGVLGASGNLRFEPGEYLGIANKQDFSRFFGIDKSIAFNSSQTIVPAVPGIPGLPKVTKRIFGRRVTIFPGTPDIPGIPETSIGMRTESGDRVKLGLDFQAGYDLGGFEVQLNTAQLGNVGFDAVTSGSAKSLTYTGFDKPLFMLGYDAPRAYAKLDLVTDVYFNPTLYAKVLGSNHSTNLFSINGSNRTNLIDLDTGNLPDVEVAYEESTGKVKQQKPTGATASGGKNLNSNRGASGPLSKLENIGITINSSLPTADELLGNVSLENIGQTVTARLSGESTLLSLNADLAAMVNSFFPSLPVNITRNMNIAGVGVELTSKLISANLTADFNLGYNISATFDPKAHVVLEGSTQKQSIVGASGRINLASAKDLNNDNKVEAFLGFDPELTLAGRIFVRPNVTFGADFLSGGLKASFAGKSIGFNYGPVFSTPKANLFSTQFDVFNFSRTVKLDQAIGNDATYKIADFNGLNTSSSVNIAGAVTSADADFSAAPGGGTGTFSSTVTGSDYDSYLFTVTGNDIGSSMVHAGLKLGTANSTSAVNGQGFTASTNLAIRIRDAASPTTVISSTALTQLDDFARDSTAGNHSATDFSFRAGVGSRYIVDVIRDASVSADRDYKLFAANGTLTQVNAA